MIQLCSESVRMGAEGMDRIRKNTNDSACVKSYVNMKMELRIHTYPNESCSNLSC